MRACGSATLAASVEVVEPLRRATVEGELAAKRIKRGVSFSETSREEIREMIDRLTSNARAAAAVFMTEDPRAARRLLGEKGSFGNSNCVWPTSISDGRAPAGQRASR
jgi:hypothetical protein